MAKMDIWEEWMDRYDGNLDRYIYKGLMSNCNYGINIEMDISNWPEHNAFM